MIMLAVLREKVPNVLSRCDTKRRMVHPSSCSFGMTSTFPKKKKNFQKIKKVGVIPKEGPSFFWYDNDSGYYGPFRITQPMLGEWVLKSGWKTSRGSDRSHIDKVIAITVQSVTNNNIISLNIHCYTEQVSLGLGLFQGVVPSCWQVN